MKPLPLLIAVTLLSCSTLFGDEEKPKVKKQTTRPAIFADSRLEKHRATAKWNANWSKYGTYLQKLAEHVQAEFDRNCAKTTKLPESGTLITIKFKLQKTGTVTEMTVVEGDAGSTAAAICIAAVSTEKPYEPWTDEMIKELGDSQEMIWTFYFGQP